MRDKHHIVGKNIKLWHDQKSWIRLNYFKPRTFPIVCGAIDHVSNDVLHI